ncbi:MAG: RNA-binding protein [Evtepia sp.]|jgi:RNA-binding protein YlmH|nr:RNA-binding protein [Evtepia sp.]
MTKTQLLMPYSSNPELRLVLAKLLDKRAMTETRDLPACSGFLSPEERGLAEDIMKKLPPVNTVFFGGFEGAERQICAFLPSWMTQEDWLCEDECPVCAIKADVSSMSDLTHRDYLGSLMALGISREKFGDILRQEHGCQLLLLREVLPVVCSQWEKVGRHPLKIKSLPFSELIRETPRVRKLRDTVASMRLDGVVAAGFSVSRANAVELISAGRVLRNHRICDKADQIVESGDVFSCRGLGKFLLSRADGKSKKGRIIIELDRYE